MEKTTFNKVVEKFYLLFFCFTIIVTSAQIPKKHSSVGFNPKNSIHKITMLDFMLFIDTTILKSEFECFDKNKNRISQEEVTKLDSSAEVLYHFKRNEGKIVGHEKFILGKYKKVNNEWLGTEYNLKGSILSDSLKYKCYGKEDYYKEDRDIDPKTGEELIVTIKKNDSLKPPDFLSNNHYFYGGMEFYDASGKEMKDRIRVFSDTIQNRISSIDSCCVYLINEKKSNGKSTINEKIQLLSYKKIGQEWKVVEYKADGSVWDSYIIYEDPNKKQNGGPENRDIDPNTGEETITRIFFYKTLRK